jgi:transposase
VSGNGVPLAATITGANRHDVTQLVPLVDAVPPVRGRRGRPRRRPARVLGDRAYGSKGHRAELRRRGVRLQAARPGDPHGSGPGTERWVVERTIAWVHANRRLKVRYDRRADIHQAFLTLACIKVCGSVLFDGYR